MASADERCRFATDRFLRDGIGRPPSEESTRLWDIYRLVDDESFSRVIDQAMRSVGALVERQGWQSLGHHLGYLDAPEPLDEEDLKVVRKVLEASEISKWPLWIRSFAANVAYDANPERFWANVPLEETIAVFQTAMLIADELHDPLISSLQWVLQSTTSPLDEGPEKPGADAVYAQFQNFRSENPTVRRQVRELLAQSVAGLLKLIEVMASFDNLFSNLGESRFRDQVLEGEHRLKVVFEVFPGKANRFAIARATGNLVTWRLNLRDQQTVNRLSVVVDAFWDVCEKQLRQHLQHGITWTASSSHEAFVEMMERWRDRADPEPDTESVSLGALYRSAPQEQKLARSEGSFEL